MRKYITIIGMIFAFSFGLASSTSGPKPQLHRVLSLNSQNLVFIDGPINHGSIREAQRELTRLLKLRGHLPYPIYVAFRSPGGNVSAGMYLYEQLKTATNVHTIMIEAFSMGAILPQLIAGKRYVLESSEIMLHRISYVFSNEQLQLEELEKLVKRGQAFEDYVESKVAHRSERSLMDYRDRITKDWYMGAHEAIEQKFADEIVVLHCDDSLQKEHTIIIPGLPPFLPDQKIKKVKCPIIL